MFVALFFGTFALVLIIFYIGFIFLVAFIHVLRKMFNRRKR